MNDGKHSTQVSFGELPELNDFSDIALLQRIRGGRK